MKENPDLKLIAVVGPHPRDIPPTYHKLFPGEERSALTRFELEAVVSRGSLASMKKSGLIMPPLLIELEEAKFRRNLAKVEQQNGSQFAQLLSEGRLDVSILLDSIGGETIIFRDLKNMMEAVRSSQGKIGAFVDQQAISAAAEILIRADNRNGLSRSNLLWHAPYTPPEIFFDEPEDPEADEYERENREREFQETVERIKSIIGMSAPDQVDSFLSKIDKGEWGEPQIHITGKEAHQFGIFETVHRNTAGLAGEFSRRTPTSIDIENGGDAVSDFFFLGKIREEIQNALGVDLDLTSTSPGNIICYLPIETSSDIRKIRAAIALLSLTASDYKRVLERRLPPE